MTKNKTDDLIYSYKDNQYKDLYYSMVKITKENWEFWNSYDAVDTETFKKKSKDHISHLPETNEDEKKTKQFKEKIIDHIEDARSAFDVMWDSKSLTEQYVVIASYEPILDPNNIDISNLEMTMMVTTSENAPITSHMGISRTFASMSETKPVHKNVSLTLHAFAATVMKERDPKKLYMINAPLKNMRDMMLKEFKTQNIRNAVFNTADITINENDKDTEWAKKVEIEKNNIAQGKDHRRLVQDNGKMIFYDHKKEMLVEIDRKKPGEYIWLTENNTIDKNNGIIFDQEKLSKLRDIPAIGIFQNLNIEKLEIKAEFRNVLKELQNFYKDRILNKTEKIVNDSKSTKENQFSKK